jgi:hypothetical protein
LIRPQLRQPVQCLVQFVPAGELHLPELLECLDLGLRRRRVLLDERIAGGRGRLQFHAQRGGRPRDGPEPVQLVAHQSALEDTGAPNYAGSSFRAFTKSFFQNRPPLPI